MKHKISAEKRYILNFAMCSVGYILLGLVLILAPERGKLFICFLLGICAIILGISRIAWHFIKDDISRAFHNDIPAGVVFLIAGVYLFARPEAVYGWLPVILGFAVVFDSIIKLQHAFDLKRTGFAHWWWILAAALATGVLGLLLIMGVFGKAVLVYYFGAVLVSNGVINLATIALLGFHKKKHQKKEKASQHNDTPTPPEEQTPQ